MKTLIFFVVVLMSGYYLLSKTDEGAAILNSDILTRYLPHQQIENASDTLLKNVDNRLQEVTTKLAQEQKHGMAQLEKHITALSTQLNELKEQQAQAKQSSKSEAKNKELIPDVQAITQHVNNKAEPKAYDEQTTLVQNISGTTDSTNSDGLGINDIASVDVNAANERKAIQRQKQASLQFITSRMEQLSVEVGSGIY